MKEHPWLKYYPWKELYDKKLDAPFIPKIGDNFDKKYCETADKIGLDTRERYEKYIREDHFHLVFQHFTFANIVTETSKEKETATPRHHERKSSLQTINVSSNSSNPNLLKNKVKVVVEGSNGNQSILSNNINNPNYNQNLYNNFLQNSSSISNLNNKNIPYRNRRSGNSLAEVSTSNMGSSLNQNPLTQRIAQNNITKGMINSKYANMSNLEKLKITKKITNSSSTNTLFKNYKQSTNSSSTTTGSVNSLQNNLNFMSKRSGSTTNFNY